MFHDKFSSCICYLSFWFSKGGFYGYFGRFRYIVIEYLMYLISILYAIEVNGLVRDGFRYIDDGGSDSREVLKRQREVESSTMV